MYGYKAFYKDKTCEVYAETLLQARNKAVEHFKAPKGKRWLVNVYLCEENGQPVVHMAVD